MDALHFLHQFYEFNHGKWAQSGFLREVTEKELEEYFNSSTFKQRNLNIPNPKNFSNAIQLYEKITARESQLEITHWDPDHINFPSQILNRVSREQLPALFYARGNKEIPAEKKLIAVVGTRKASLNALRWTQDFVRYYRSLGIQICSGLAIGIDQAAHQECPSSIAVLGGGIDKIYPQENQVLAESIVASNGTLLSQFPLLQVPLSRNFPQRNRWIAALSVGVLVVEGAEKSGAAITGKLALEMGKHTVTLTQDFRTAFGRGAIRLYEAGATLVTNECESVQALYASKGGYMPDPLALPIRVKFSVEDFQRINSYSLKEAIAVLERACRAGRIERLGGNSFRSC